MGRFRGHLDHEERQRIEAAVQTAEQATCGELIPVVTRRSAPYGHAPWLAAALILAAAEGSGLSWSLALAWGRSRWLGVALDLLSAGLAGWLLTRWSVLRRALTPPKDRLLAVHRAAEAAFHRLALHRARGDAGVLLYVSLDERRAVVLAGAGIADLAGPEHWTQCCRLLTEGAAQGDLAGGFERSIALAATVLAEHHPRTGSNGAPVLTQRLRILHHEW